ncbi:hypothetical protein [Streptomyces sp. VRA16 Mangrove soil]|uniref:hypothetical protein n=1 Tax=Streptomyces sp. VRA16 Mangrove soil TaxID=2817434 RepID=UPI001A9F9170|nr:hypothetical protein [Streptomyces sp. VRA16 Mangrove soil]MBO1333196.1 hypothetical protein [Streptomyces sp. VRA16 Mangrove soil]
MVVVITSVIAVLGTLLGAALTPVLQGRATARSERFAREERLRQERIDAYCAFGGALANYRRGQLDRWFRRLEERSADPADVHELRREAQRLRAAAIEAMFRVELLTDAPGLIAKARGAFAAVDDLSRTDDRNELAAARAASRNLLYEFIAASRPHVRHP